MRRSAKQLEKGNKGLLWFNDGGGQDREVRCDGSGVELVCWFLNYCHGSDMGGMIRDVVWVRMGSGFSHVYQ